MTPTQAKSLSSGGVVWIDQRLVVALQREEEAHITTPDGLVTPVYQGELRQAGSTIFRYAVFDAEALRSLDGVVIDIRNRRGETRRVEPGTKR